MSVLVVKPITITESMITATDVTEADYPVWAAGTTYALADRVIVLATHKVYQSVQASNLGKDPTLAANSTWWTEVGPTNKWKLFDTSNSTQTVRAGSFSYTVKLGESVNAVALLNVVASTVRVRMTDSVAGLVYDKSFSLAGVIPAPTWYDYFFAVMSPYDQLIALDLPPYASASIQVDVTDNSGDAKCGVLMFGYQVGLANGIKYGARAGITDYSRKETNAWGDTVLNQRAFSKRRDWSMEVPNDQIDMLERRLIAVRATPCLWVGHSNYAVTTVFGFYKDWDITISYPTFSDCSLTIEGMT